MHLVLQEVTPSLENFGYWCNFGTIFIFPSKILLAHSHCSFIMLGCYTLRVCEVIRDAVLLSLPVVCSLIGGSVGSVDKKQVYYFSLEERTWKKLCNE